VPEKINFYSEGYKLAGLLYRPEKISGKVPGIVVCHGFGGLKEGTPPNICKFLSSRGYLVFSFDYRGFGESQGITGRINPWEQAADIKNAITCLQTLNEVEPGRIGLYGTSYGGGNVVYVTATDQRVKCTVSTVPVANGERWMKSIRRHWEWVELVKRLEKDRTQRVLTGCSELVDRYEIMVPDPETEAFYGKIFEQFPEQRTRLALETVDYVITFKPEDYVHLISPRPIMFIHSADDHLVDPEESVSLYRRAGEPKRLEMIAGASHFGVYTDEAFNQVMSFTGEWFDKYLPL